MEKHLVIKTEGLTKTYHQKKGESIQALKEINLSVARGEVFGLLGPNGAGKTTLVRILTTLLRATSGNAQVCGYDVQQDEYHVRSAIGYAGQDSERSAYFRLTIQENFLYFAHALRGVPLDIARQRIHEIADRIGFKEQLDKEFTTLSGGQKQLMIVIRALLHHPKLVFLDEPSKSLDPVTAERVRSFLLDYAQTHGMTVLLTTHNMDEAEATCDRLAFINQGQLQFVGTPQQFQHSVTVQDIVQVSLQSQDGIKYRLQELQGVNRTVGNETIRLYCDDGFKVLGQVVDVLKEAGTKASVSMVEPSLEDAFSVFVNNNKETKCD
jgi:ABC-2 type transport system ATP-binding protein